MLSDLLKNILSEHKNYVSLSELESVLYNKKTRVKINNYVSYSSLYTANKGFMFMKKALSEMKEAFLKEFEEYVASKSIDSEAAMHLKAMYSQHIPDGLYPEWYHAHLENRLMIFDLLLQFMVRGKNANDPLKKYFYELIDLYSLIAVYSIVLVKSCNENYEKLTGYLKTIDPEEELVKTMIYELLVDPISVLPKLHEKHDALEEISAFVDRAVDASFRVSIHYSQHLFKKVISNELERFEPVNTLSRFGYDTLYEWVLMLIENQELQIPSKIIDDLFE